MSVWSLDFHVVGQLAHVITTPIIKRSHDEWSVALLSKPPTKSASTNSLNPFGPLGFQVNPLLIVTSRYLHLSSL